MTNQNLSDAGRKFTADALTIELAWSTEPAPAPSPNRPALEGEAELGFTLSEPQFAAAVQDLLELSEIPDALEQVIKNRTTLAAYRDAGVEPWEVVQHILSRRREAEAAF